MTDTIPKTYFVSDFHLGVPDGANSRARERRLVAWLEAVRPDAGEIFLLGDLFDFWFEYGTVVPRGYARLLGKLAEIGDGGVPVHLFRGNHDMWAFRYLEEELNVRLHRDPEIFTLQGKRFYLAHGDGLGPGDRGYKFLKRVFANRFFQSLFKWLHPDLGIRTALFWSRKSRAAALTRESRDEAFRRRLIDTRLTTHSRAVLAAHPDLDYLVYGHYHYPALTRLNERTCQVVLGDWLTHFTYAVFDGEKLTMKEFPPQAPGADGEAVDPGRAAALEASFSAPAQQSRNRPKGSESAAKKSTDG